MVKQNYDYIEEEVTSNVVALKFREWQRCSLTALVKRILNEPLALYSASNEILNEPLALGYRGI